MFSVLFGLSMDYEVFLVSRMQEEWVISHDNRSAVTKGQAETGSVITAAALIMILVFFSFLLGRQHHHPAVRHWFAAAIIIDAFIVRTVLVPAMMHMVGPANWWFPRAMRRQPAKCLNVGNGCAGHARSPSRAAPESTEGFSRPSSFGDLRSAAIVDEAIRPMAAA